MGNSGSDGREGVDGIVITYGTKMKRECLGRQIYTWVLAPWSLSLFWPDGPSRHTPPTELTKLLRNRQIYTWAHSHGFLKRLRNRHIQHGFWPEGFWPDGFWPAELFKPLRDGQIYTWVLDLRNLARRIPPTPTHSVSQTFAKPANLHMGFGLTDRGSTTDDQITPTQQKKEITKNTRDQQKLGFNTENPCGQQNPEI